jgi:CHAT domain
VDTTSYVDFDLLVERAGKKCRARVLASPAGTTTPIEFPVPIRRERLQIFILTVGRPRQNVRRIETPVEQDVKDLGTRLYRSVFRDQIRDCLKTSETEARRQGAGLRIRLHLDVSAADLPWEFLFDDAKESFLSLSRMTPIVRYLEIDDVPMPLKLDPPLRVLAVISSPSDYPQLDVEGEWARLNGALAAQREAGTVHVERLAPVTIDELLQVLQRGTYHVLHFIGHGGFRRSTEEGVLIFQDESGASREVTGEELGILLQDHPSLRLVVLNSCEGARGDVRDPFSGTAQSLIRRRIPSVIAMQFEITDTAALRFSQSFYGALAGNYPIDAAVAEARKSIRLAGNEFEWGTPVLYMMSPDGRVFELPKEAELVARETLEREQAAQDQAEQPRPEQERPVAERVDRADVPSQEEVVAGGQPPAPRGVESRPQPPSQPPPPPIAQPWWRRRAAWIVGGVLAFFLIGGITQAISEGGGVGPNPPPDTFFAQADTICSRFNPQLLNDWNNGSSTLAQDTQALIAALSGLGSPPSNPDVWQLGLQDWQQAVVMLNTLGPEDWKINMMAGAHEFASMGLQACGSIGS